jgi:hypothetical protein
MSANAGYGEYLPVLRVRFVVGAKHNDNLRRRQIEEAMLRSQDEPIVDQGSTAKVKPISIA